jgi:hypothetical protein
VRVLARRFGHEGGLNDCVGQMGDEAFYIDEHGQRPMLTSITRFWTRLNRKYGVRAAMGAVAMGIDPAVAARVYVVDLADLSDPPAAEGAGS